MTIERFRFSLSLRAVLMDAICQYTRHFNRKPTLLKVPFWRIAELPDCDREHIGTGTGSYFCGIRTQFTITSDAIELE